MILAYIVGRLIVLSSNPEFSTLLVSLKLFCSRQCASSDTSQGRGILIICQARVRLPEKAPIVACRTAAEFLPIVLECFSIPTVFHYLIFFVYHLTFCLPLRDMDQRTPWQRDFVLKLN